MNKELQKEGASREVRRAVNINRSGVKRIIIPLLFVLLFMPASATPIITLGDSDIYSEVNVTVPLMIKDVEDVAAATIKVSYDPSVIVVTAAGNSDFDNFIPNLWYADKGWVKMTGYNTVEGISGDVKFAELTMEPRGDYGESSELTIEVETLSDSMGTPIYAEVINGSFYIGKSSNALNSDSGTNGGSGGSTSTSTPTLTPTPAPTPTPSPPPTPSANVTITPSPSPLSFQPEEPGIVTVQVGDVTVGKGEFANITITIKGVGGEGLSSALINLTYDSNIVKVVSAGNSDFDMFVSNIGDRKVRMVGFQTGAEGLKGDVKFAEIQVKAVGKANESSELKLEVKELKDNEGFPVHFEVEDGCFSIKGEEGAGHEPSKPIIPTVGVVETIAVIVGSYFVRLRRRQ